MCGASLSMDGCVITVSPHVGCMYDSNWRWHLCALISECCHVQRLDVHVVYRILCGMKLTVENGACL